MNNSLKFGLPPVAMVLAAVVSWTAGVHDARAPELPVLQASLCCTTGASATAKYPSTGQPTTAARFPASATTTGCTASMVTGMPCSTTSLSSGSQVHGILTVNVNNTGIRKCACDMKP